MKAAVYREYGGPEQLVLQDVAIPTPAPREILVKVGAVSLNASDIEFLSGSPAYVRAWGWSRPKYTILGSDVAGRVEAVGDQVTRFKVGDLVFGDLLDRWGGLAECVTAHERSWAAIPAGLTPEQACMIPQAGVVAWQGIAACGELQGKHLLINGAGGGSGTFAIQVAKLLGAGQVTAVDRGNKATAMHDLGADHTIDFEGDDYTTRRHSFDAILDLVGSRTLAENARALAPRGQYYLVGGSLSRILGAVGFGGVRSLFTTRKYRLLVVQQSAKALADVGELCAAGKLRPIHGRTFPLSEVRQAFAAVQSGSFVGKVVVVPS